MKNTKTRKIIRRSLIAIGALIIVFFIALTIYSINPYKALPEMQSQIDSMDTSNVTVKDSLTSIKYMVDNPEKNIIFIPGGLVKPDAYSYLAISIAKEGYDVTIIKPMFHLAILMPNQAGRYTDKSMDNVVIGHSLGGVVASMVANKNPEITSIVMMGSYPIKDITDKKTLLITAEYDIAMDQEAFNSSMKYVNDSTQIINIDGGNHAQFGWYGPQKGDGTATISTLAQQDLVIHYILDFLNN